MSIQRYEESYYEAFESDEGDFVKYEDHLSELAAFREELETSRVAHHETAKVANDLQHRLAAAEQRNADLEELLRDGINSVQVLSETPDTRNEEQWVDLHAWTFNADDALKPTESGASE